MDLNFFSAKGKWRKLLSFCTLLLLIYFAFCLPKNLFDKPYSTVIESSDGKLLNATIASDGQWRFPPNDSVPNKFEQCLIAFEDRNFHSHFGVYFPSVFRAFYQNIKAGKVVSGGSTLTMQIARMARNKSRNVFQKIIEIIWAFRLELSHSKEELLNIYAANAPFGGNVVGLDAASWRYFGIAPHKLTWSQAATLSVLPNAPALIFPGRNQAQLIEKRNRVLAFLLQEGEIDSTSYSLALEEGIPGKPYPLPSLSPHLLDYFKKSGLGQNRIQTSINLDLQKQLLDLGVQYQEKFNSNYIHNAAILVIDLKSNSVIGYVGNTASSIKHDQFVDIIQSPRSTGSTLKPFLFASMLMEGELHNKMLIPDIPMQFENFSPKNYFDRFDGAVKAENALSRSLNVPAVYLLRKHGIQKFLHTLQKAGLENIDKSADHYGLSLILGGAEASLWNLTSVYAGMAKCLNSYKRSPLKYSKLDWQKPSVLRGKQKLDSIQSAVPYLFDRASIYLTFQALTQLSRPNAESGWKYFSSSKKIAWKTGTSFGNRDAWSIGVTPDYAVGVWVGNASGEGRPSLVGVESAAPLMFDVFSKLKDSQAWFEYPESEMREVSICTHSGYRSTPQCTETETVISHYRAERCSPCDFHKTILSDGHYRYYVDCAKEKQLQEQTFFVLKPVQEWFYKKKNPTYKTLPAFHPDCISLGSTGRIMDIIYPKYNTEIITTRDLSSEKNSIVFELAHRDSQAKVFWHVDGKYLGSTREVHKMSYLPELGSHTLFVIDENGNQESVNFKILGNEN